MKYLVPNYSCLQIPVLSVLSSSEFVEPPPPRTKFLGTPLLAHDVRKLTLLLVNLFHGSGDTSLLMWYAFQSSSTTNLQFPERFAPQPTASLCLLVEAKLHFLISPPPVRLEPRFSERIPQLNH